MNRFPFLDWMRGLAVVIMIQCHTFNSFVRMDLRESGPYMLSQFIGGIAAPFFLFMAGMTSGFQMESLERRESTRSRRWLVSLRRAGYVWGIAYLFRFTNWASGWPNSSPSELTKVDILNCMGLGMAVLAAIAVLDSKSRARAAALAGIVIAAAAPVAANLDWSGAPALLREYLVPGPGRGRFAFFPCASYIAFGIAAGAIVKRTAAENMERLMQWSVLGGLTLVIAARHFGTSPFSLYENSNFWTNSPALILIRVGICLVALAAGYVWTTHFSGKGWSWMMTLGRASLLVYWVHVVMVYGLLAGPFRRALGLNQTVLATLGITALMVGLAAARLQWTARKRVPVRDTEAPAPLAIAVGAGPSGRQP